MPQHPLTDTVCIRQKLYLFHIRVYISENTTKELVYDDWQTNADEPIAHIVTAVVTPNVLVSEQRRLNTTLICCISSVMCGLMTFQNIVYLWKDLRKTNPCF